MSSSARALLEVLFCDQSRYEVDRIVAVAAFRPEHELEPVDVLFIEVADSCLEVEVPQPDSTEAESELLSLKIVCMSTLHCTGIESVKTAAIQYHGGKYCEKNLSVLCCALDSAIVCSFVLSNSLNSRASKT